MDLYNIPGDNKVDYRLKKFVEYQHNAPSVHYRFLGEWLNKNQKSPDEIVWLAFVLAITYCEITTILVDLLFRNRKKEYFSFWRIYKEKLVFGSAKRYVKNKDLFPELMFVFDYKTGGKYYNWLLSHKKDSPEATYKSIYDDLLKMKEIGRLSADFFLETIVFLKNQLNLNISEPKEIDWNNGQNLTSGLYNIFYEDEKARLFEQKKRLPPKEAERLSAMIVYVKKAISETYPEQNSDLSQWIGKLCSFRNLFKGKRYAGYHHDRQLQTIKKYEILFPQQKRLWKECYEIRKKIFPARFLGELNGWNGIRKERTKYWLNKGLTCAEEE